MEAPASTLSRNMTSRCYTRHKTISTPVFLFFTQSTVLHSRTAQVARFPWMAVLLRSSTKAGSCACSRGSKLKAQIALIRKAGENENDIRRCSNCCFVSLPAPLLICAITKACSIPQTIFFGSELFPLGIRNTLPASRVQSPRERPRSVSISTAAATRRVTAQHQNEVSDEEFQEVDHPRIDSCCIPNCHLLRLCARCLGMFLIKSHVSMAAET